MLMVGDIISVPVSTNQQEAYMTEQFGHDGLIHCNHSHKLTYLTHSEPSSVLYDRYTDKPSLYTSVGDLTNSSE